MSALRWFRFWWHVYIGCYYCDERYCPNGLDLWRLAARTTGKAGSR